MAKQRFRTASHAAFSLQYHIVFVIKYRHKCITSEMLARLEEILGETLTKWRCKLIEFNGEADHVHLLVEAHPAMDLSRLVGNLKTVSARKVKVEFADHLSKFFWKPYFWSKSYAVSSAAGSVPLEKLIEYIQHQDASLTND